MSCAYSTPRISLVDLKTAVLERVPVQSRVVHAVSGYWVGTGWVPGRGIPGGYYTGYYPADAYIGIARAQPVAQHAFLRPDQALQAPAGPSAHLALPALNIAPGSQIGRDSTSNILKLVIIRECHRFSSMRPGIVPISKTGQEVTTLNFPIFQYGQPSLTRNKWS